MSFYDNSKEERVNIVARIDKEIAEDIAAQTTAVSFAILLMKIPTSVKQGTWPLANFIKIARPYTLLL